MAGTPTYQRVAAAVRARIRDGELRPGDRAPSTRELVREHGIAAATAARALRELREQGLLVTVPRSGSVVAGAAPAVAATGGVRGTDGARTPPDRAAAVAAAVAVADAEGLPSVTLRRIAAELGVPTVALTTLVPGREELVRGMIAAVLQTSPLPPPVGDWRRRLTASARRQWQLYRDHPWLPHVIALNRPQPVGALLELGEHDLAALQQVEPDPVARMDLHVAVTAFVRGLAADLAAEEQARADTGLDVDAWTDLDPALARVYRAHAGPALRAVGDYPYDVDRVFERGLAVLLDGLAARRRPSRGAAAVR